MEQNIVTKMCVYRMCVLFHDCWCLRDTCTCMPKCTKMHVVPFTTMYMRVYMHAALHVHTKAQILCSTRAGFTPSSYDLCHRPGLQSTLCAGREAPAESLALWGVICHGCVCGPQDGNLEKVLRGAVGKPVIMGVAILSCPEESWFLKLPLVYDHGVVRIKGAGVPSLPCSLSCRMVVGRPLAVLCDSPGQST
jgi:hypothetical protein